MNKAELVDAIVKKTGETKRKTEGYLDAFVETVMEEVAKGGKVSVVGFGSFERRHREARMGRNPARVNLFRSRQKTILRLPPERASGRRLAGNTVLFLFPC